MGADKDFTAKAVLEKARSIAQLNSPQNPEKRFAEDAEDSKSRAAIARASPRASGKGGAMAFLREEDADDEEDEEEDYDVLVPLFYR
ncbi:uncharacterized protein RAG0_09298 [Rhynchosporium agropyri]|uniref:Uncharacterized protein n=1 Tax=Rhynchosporium agropyri TaxID=914238 RepID=A0A1E1KUV8_9HELO|nr:uncharacterized protein RAG0_09298 [Rhynchosporium agropyri]